MSFFVAILLLLTGAEITAQVVGDETRSGAKLARLKYAGGGDWYNDPSAEVNLLEYVRSQTNIDVVPVYEFVDLRSDNLFQYPMIFMTGHGTVNFSSSDAQTLAGVPRSRGLPVYR